MKKLGFSPFLINYTGLFSWCTKMLVVSPPGLFSCGLFSWIREFSDLCKKKCKGGVFMWGGGGREGGGDISRLEIFTPTKKNVIMPKKF